MRRGIKGKIHHAKYKTGRYSIENRDIFSVPRNIPYPDKTSRKIEKPAYDAYNTKFYGDFDKCAVRVFRSKTTVKIFLIWVFKGPRPITKYRFMDKSPETCFPDFCSSIQCFNLSRNTGYFLFYFPLNTI